MRVIKELILMFWAQSDEDRHEEYEREQKEKSKKRARKMMHEEALVSLKLAQENLRNGGNN